MFLPINLRYTNNHLWLRDVGKKDAYVRITDYAQKELGRIDSIEIQEGSEKNNGESFGVVYGANKCMELVMPFAGQILIVNPDIVKHPRVLNSAPYHHWVILLAAVTNLTEFMSKYFTLETYKQTIATTKNS